MSEKLRLTLTTSALERLIGGDTETELDLRQAVVAEFAKRHLGAILKSSEFQKAIEDYKETIREEAAKVFGEAKKDKPWESFKYELSSEVKDSIRTVAMEAFNQEMEGVRKEMRERVSEVRDLAQERIKEAVSDIRKDLYTAVNKVVNEETRREIRVRIEKVLDTMKKDLEV